MAVDSRDKRASCLNVGRPGVFSAPNPDSDLDSVADRQHIAYTYRGITAGRLKDAVVFPDVVGSSTTSASVDGPNTTSADVVGSSTLFPDTVRPN